MLRGVVLIAIAASCATSAGAAPATEGCTPRPEGAAPPGQHWYYVLDRATKSQCWHLGPLGLAVPKAAAPTARSGHRGAPVTAAMPAPAAAVPQASEAAAAPPAAATETVAPAVVSEPSAFAAPQPPAAAVAEQPAPAPRIAPPAAVAASESRSADAVGSVRAPAPAPTSQPAQALQAAPIAQPARAAAGMGETDHSFALIVLAATLVIIVGPVLAFTRMLSKAMVRSESRRTPAALALARSMGRADERV